MSRRRIRVLDVARHAGVSRTTAAYVLAETEPYFSQYAAETIARVREAAEELGYVRNVFAASLRTRSFPLIGVYFDFTRPTSGPLIHGVPQNLWEVFSGIAQACIEIAYYPLLIARPSLQYLDEEQKRLDEVRGIPFAGMVVSARDDLWDRVFFGWDRKQAPCVKIYSPFPGKRDQWAVDTDNIKVGRLAAREIRKRGASDVLLVHKETSERAIADRIRGFRDGMGKEQRGRDVLLPEDAAREESFVVEHLRKKPPQAIYAPSSGLTDVVSRALDRLGIRYPEECLLVGIDIPKEEILSHRIIQISSPGYEIGYRAVHLLYERISGKGARPRVEKVDPEVFPPTV